MLPREVEEFGVEYQAWVGVELGLSCGCVRVAEDGSQAGLPFGVGGEWVGVEGGEDGVFGGWRWGVRGDGLGAILIFHAFQDRFL